MANHKIENTCQVGTCLYKVFHCYWLVIGDFRPLGSNWGVIQVLRHHSRNWGKSAVKSQSGTKRNVFSIKDTYFFLGVWKLFDPRYNSLKGAGTSRLLPPSKLVADQNLGNKQNLQNCKCSATPRICDSFAMCTRRTVFVGRFPIFIRTTTPSYIYVPWYSIKIPLLHVPSEPWDPKTKPATLDISSELRDVRVPTYSQKECSICVGPRRIFNDIGIGLNMLSSVERLVEVF